MKKAEMEAKVAELEMRLAILEGKQAQPPPEIAPVNPPKTAPTKLLIDQWIACRAKKKLGPEGKLARHAQAFADLWKRCMGDTELSLTCIEVYFADTRHWVVDRGWNIDLFQKMMDGLIVESNRRRQRTQAALPPTQAPQAPSADDQLDDAFPVPRKPLSELVAALKQRKTR